MIVEGDDGGLTTEDRQMVMPTDLNGLSHASRAAILYLKSLKGSILNGSPVSGTGDDWGTTAYNAAEGAVTNLMQSMDRDHGKDGVQVNAVNSSFAATDLTQDMVDDKQLVGKFNERFAPKGPAKPEKVATVIAFLASDDARVATGGEHACRRWHIRFERAASAIN
jgi:meso-butanediol dehydrogenase / (S,S)-butanediol dehydrogenase / diacetyl reductase